MTIKIGDVVQINGTPIYFEGHEANKDAVGDIGVVTDFFESDGCYEVDLDFGHIVYFTIDHLDKLEA